MRMPGRVAADVRRWESGAVTGCTTKFTTKTPERVRPCVIRLRAGAGVGRAGRFLHPNPARLADSRDRSELFQHGVGNRHRLVDDRDSDRTIAVAAERK